MLPDVSAKAPIFSGSESRRAIKSENPMMPKLCMPRYRDAVSNIEKSSGVRRLLRAWAPKAPSPTAVADKREPIEKKIVHMLGFELRSCQIRA